jgi:phytoene desaturase
MNVPASHGLNPTSIVIGGGFGGIGAAIRLRARGHKVTLIEKLDRIGGRAQVFEREGFRHDAGPTVITAPFMFEELFTLLGERLEDHIKFVPLDPWYRFYFADGQEFNYYADFDTLLAEIGRFDARDAEGYKRMLAASKDIFDVGFSELADQTFLNFRDMLAQLPNLMRLRSDRTVWQFVSKYLRHPHIRRAFSIPPLLVGGNPFTTTSIYSLIHYLERAWGVHFCMGGTGALVNALEDLMRRHHITIKTGAEVEEIEMGNGRATGVRLKDGQRIAASHVVCNADPPSVYQHLLPKHEPLAQKPKRPLPEALTQYSMGLFVLYFGTTRRYENVAHHTIWLGDRYKSLLADIFDRKVLSDDFSLYVHRPTATDSSFAPQGCDSFYVLCPVPNLQANVDWSNEGPKLRDRIVAALDATILPDLKKTITADFWMDPVDFKRDYNAMHGAGFSISPIFRQSAWFRYKNRDPHIQNLYFVGAGTHPGAGLPGVLSSAKALERLFPQPISSLNEVLV